MSIIKLAKKDYSDGRTKQSFKDETDVNKILHRAQQTGTMSHITKHEGRYADFSDFDFVENQTMLTRGREIFDELPSELRTEFEQSPAKFFAYVNDPANAGKLGKKLPDLAKPGKQNIDVSGKTAPAVASELSASVNASPAVTPAPTPSSAPESAPAA